MASPSVINNTIALSTGPFANSKFEEGICGSTTIYPGMLLIVSGAGTVHPHLTADGFAERLVAVENPYAGGTIDTPYTVGVRVMMRIALPGDVFLMKYNGGTALTYGNPLSSNGDGWLRETVTPATDWIVAASLEADAAPVLPRWTRVRFA